MDDMHNMDRNPDDWERSGDVLQDQLKMYTESYYYDCTFCVGDGSTKIFKCHKLILARASRVFQRMLLGDFQEAAKDKDDPIMLKDLLPEAFDLVMRYIYGNAREFHSAGLACEVFKFAHEWQMDGLMSASAEYLEDVKPENVLLVYEMFKLLNYTANIDHYRRIIFESTSEVLSSPYWLNATSSTIEEIFEKDKLKINSEKELFFGLLMWGTHNTDPKIDSAIRLKIDCALKLIRFRSMSAEEFAEICSVTSVLSEKEKLQILMSINLGDVSYMPKFFSTRNDFRDHVRKLRHTFKSKCLTQDICINEELTESCFKFLIEGRGLHFLSGIVLYCLGEKNDGLVADLHCSLKKSSSGQTLAIARFKGAIDSGVDGKIEFSPPVPLRENVWYTLLVRYSCKLHTKKVEYPDIKDYWVWPHLGAKIYHSKDQFSHTDITALYFVNK